MACSDIAERSNNLPPDNAVAAQWRPAPRSKTLNLEVRSGVRTEAVVGAQHIKGRFVRVFTVQAASNKWQSFDHRWTARLQEGVGSSGWIDHGHHLTGSLSGRIKQPVGNALVVAVLWSAQKDQLDRFNQQALDAPN